MGIDTIREFAQRFLNICTISTDISQVAEALRREDVIDCLRGAWDEIPSDSKTFIADQLKKKKKANTKPISDKTITTREDIRSLLQSWSSDPSTFLQGPTTQLGYGHPANLYNSLEALDRSQAVGIIQWRLTLVAFGESKERLQIRRVREGSEAAFVNIIISSGLVTGNIEEVKKKSLLWATIGLRLKRIAFDLGGIGALIVMPEDISQKQLVRIPLNKGPEYPSFIEGLKERGICEEAEALNAHNVANNILSLLCPMSCTWVDAVVSTATSTSNKRRRPNSEIPPPVHRDLLGAIDRMAVSAESPFATNNGMVTGSLPLPGGRNVNGDEPNSERPPPPRSTMPVNTMLCSDLEVSQYGIQGEGSPKDHGTLLGAMDRMAVSAITTPTGSSPLPGSRYETEPPFGTVTNFAGDHVIPQASQIDCRGQISTFSASHPRNVPTTDLPENTSLGDRSDQFASQRPPHPQYTTPVNTRYLRVIAHAIAIDEVEGTGTGYSERPDDNQSNTDNVST